MQGIVFEKSYEVRSYDTGQNGKLRPDALLNYLQDIAGYHASELKFGKEDLLKENKFWVLVRIVFSISSTPVWNDIITIKTWPKGLDSIFAIRNFSIYDNKGEVIGEASSSWIILDTESRRPVRPGSELAEFEQNSPVEGFKCLPAGKIPEVSKNAYRSPVHKVRYSDLDINMHVNNAKYLQWVIDSYPLDFLMSGEAMLVEANYITETVPGENYIVMAEERDKQFYHSIVKESSGKEACRFRIDWIN